MFTIVLVCYTEFEDRIGMISDTHKGSSAYDIVKKYTKYKVGKFTSSDVVVYCPCIGRTSVLASSKRFTEEGLIGMAQGGVHTLSKEIVNEKIHANQITANEINL